MAAIYSKTPVGQAALQTRAALLTPRQRSALIMFDGKRASDEIQRMTIGLGVTLADIEHLIEHGLLMEAALAAPLAPAIVPSSPVVQMQELVPAAPSQDEQATYLKAYPVATRLTAGLGLRGFRLNLAVEAAGNLQKLRELAPKIKDAVGLEKFKALEDALR